MIRIYEELGDPSRRLILTNLLGGPMRVTDLCAATGLKQPNVSNHLARLREKGLVIRNKQGREAHYSLASYEVQAAVDTVAPTLPQTLDLSPAELAGLFAEVAVHGDEPACGRLVDGFLRSGGDLLSLFEDVLTVAMHLVGVWYEGKTIDEAQEHAASRVTERVIARASLSRSKSVPLDLRCLLGCPSGESHELGLRMAGDLLAALGAEVVYLGADVPQAAFGAQVARFGPDMVLLSSTTAADFPALLSLLDDLREIRQVGKRFSIVVGGPQARHNQSLLLAEGADYVADSLYGLIRHFLPKVHANSRARASML